MPSAPARSAAALLGLCCACPALALAAPAWPPAQLVNLSLAYAAREIAHLRGGTLRGSAVRDLAAAAWVTLALGNASSPSGAPPASAVADARDALDAVFAAQLGDGRFPWAFGDATCLDNNSVQFTSLPVLLAVIRFGGALGAPALARWRPHLAGAAVASFAEGSTPAGEAQPFYTNIYSMRLANLLLFGDVLGNATVAAQGLAALST